MTVPTLEFRERSALVRAVLDAFDLDLTLGPNRDDCKTGGRLSEVAASNTEDGRRPEHWDPSVQKYRPPIKAPLSMKMKR